MDAIYAELSWHRRSPRLPTTPTDRAVRKLVYGVHETEMGLVCETADGMYWSFTTNRDIICMPPKLYLVHHATVQEAALALLNYVALEVFRLMKLSSPMPYTLTRTFKKRDADAYKKYSKTIAGDTALAFKCGMEWILRSEFATRRPVWAAYMAQNLDGGLMWFEHQPVALDTGIWKSETGRSKHLFTSDSWRSSLTPLT